MKLVNVLCIGTLLSVLVAAAASTATPEQGYVTYSGTATARRNQQFLYGESHVLLYKDGKLAERVVLYTCRDGAVFARKTVAYVDELAPDFALEDATNGLRQGVRSAGTVRTVYFRGGRDEAPKESAMPQVAGLVADSGFDEFVRSNWQSLMTGSSLSMPFLLPSRGEQKRFSVQHVRSEQLDGTPAELFRLKLAGMLGAVVPSIDVYYGAADHQLLRYAGVSDLRDASNNNFDSQIDFPPAGRKASTQAAMEHALHATLAPCR